MSRKDFDAKQFLLEKGEHVGLGVAVTLMVLMLIWSLFWPGPGFFSGSPATKAKELRQSTEQLENDLRSKQPSDRDKPDPNESKMIDIDVTYLNPVQYATAPFFEPRIKENPARRPPKIYNVEEAVAEVARVPIDTYLFNKDFTKITVLTEGGKRQPGGNAGGKSPLASMIKGGPMLPGMGNPMAMMQQQRLMGGMGGQGLVGVGGANPEYETQQIPLEKWSPQELTAHQLRPLRMAIIAGSFPYRKQLNEHMNKLHLKSIDEVLAETMKSDKQLYSFRFLGVEVQRSEVDANGKTIKDWSDLPLAATYQLWLKHTLSVFEPENPKYDAIRFQGLVMPLLREFHATRANTPGIPGLMLPGMAPQREEAPAGEGKTKYPDVVAKLKKIQDTLANLDETKAKQIVAPKSQKAAPFDPFNPDAALASDNSAAGNANSVLTKTTTTQGEINAEEGFIPDYVLVRVVDVNIEPGKYYRYRLKIKMANPNYKRDDVASPDYKERESLESKDWFELPQTVSVPQEMFYYVVDETKGVSSKELNALIRALPHESALYRTYYGHTHLSANQVAFQLHRWIEATPLSRRESDLVPVGEWAIADRVAVCRGEYIGRKVQVDLPIWKFNQNTFILPAEDQKTKPGGKAKTGIDVDFGQDPPEKNLILVDFEGGPVVRPDKISDTSTLEVLMLAPDGKLLARNSAQDTNDEERKERRDMVLKRIQDVRDGKLTE